MTGPDPSPPNPAVAVYALLDDSRAGPARSSRLYTGFSHQHRCQDPATLDAWWAAVAADQQRGLHAVLLADYEWGAELLGAGQRSGPGDAPAYLRVLMFRQLQHLPAEAVAAWLQAQDDGAEAPTPAGVLDLRASVGEAEFHAAIDAIHEAIRAGETYQVNYTYRLNGAAYGSPAALYRRLRARQPVAFGAFIALPPDREPGAATHVLSLSPELFLRHEAGWVTARPMKGTAGRVAGPEGDSETARALQQDVKNRAENLMIVDLLRNDLGRIARIGSVSVPALFAVEPYATVFQMTSTVQAQLRPGITLPALLRATFPCGSITGAPKHHTMTLIRRFESTPRGLYCGAIGWIDAARPGGAYSSIGDFCFSVAIRTLTLGAPDAAAATRPLTLGVGAGIVQDSVAADEFDECRLKARFLSAMDPGFELFETLVVARHAAGPAVLQWHRHRARLGRSARALGFAWDEAAARRAVDDALADIAERDPRPAADDAAPAVWRLRLQLRHDGRLQVRWAALTPLVRDARGRVDVVLSPQRLPNADPLRAHKTTHRAVYDPAVLAAESQGAFDLLFATEDGRLAEGARSNVFVRLDGHWYTPPVGDGALPGVCRAAVLEQGLDGQPVRERTLTLDELARADELRVGNALRGVMAATLR